uniref:(northern house mosquito) hypothetical protein n=1 Tax=Culex pipiens TaxID=7175 RepID=A0A8D8HCR3_CULPI
MNCRVCLQQEDFFLHGRKPLVEQMPVPDARFRIVNTRVCENVRLLVDFTELESILAGTSGLTLQKVRNSVTLFTCAAICQLVCACSPSLVLLLLTTIAIVGRRLLSEV